MSDSKKEMWQSWQQWKAREFVAKFYAMPLRTITDVSTVKTETTGRAARVTKTAILDCGHQGVLHLWLPIGETMRCRECYVGGLQAAERMIERIGG